MNKKLLGSVMATMTLILVGLTLFGVRNKDVSTPPPPTEEVRMESNTIIIAEITHMNSDQRESQFMLPYYLVSARNKEQNFGATFYVDDETYAKYVVGETIRIRATKENGYEIVGWEE